MKEIMSSGKEAFARLCRRRLRHERATAFVCLKFISSQSLIMLSVLSVSCRRGRAVVNIMQTCTASCYQFYQRKIRSSVFYAVLGQVVRTVPQIPFSVSAIFGRAVHLYLFVVVTGGAPQGVEKPHHTFHSNWIARQLHRRFLVDVVGHVCDFVVLPGKKPSRWTNGVVQDENGGKHC